MAYVNTHTRINIAKMLYNITPSLSITFWNNAMSSVFVLPGMVYSVSVNAYAPY